MESGCTFGKKGDVPKIKDLIEMTLDAYASNNKASALYDKYGYQPYRISRKKFMES